VNLYGKTSSSTPSPEREGAQFSPNKKPLSCRRGVWGEAIIQGEGYGVR